MRLTDYNAVAANFDANKERLQIKPDLELEQVLKRPSTASPHILDLGCGTGNYLKTQREAFPAYHARWVGTDPFPGMLAVAQTKTDAPLARGFAEWLPYPTHTFDYLALNFAFHHLRDKNRALDEISRTLKEDGVLRIRNICPEQMPDWWVYQFFPETIAEDEKRFWSLDLLVDGLQDRGFSPVLTVDEHKSQRPLSEIHTQAIRRDISQLAILTADEYQQGLERIERGLAIDPDMTVSDHMVFMLCMAKRQ